MIIVKYDWLVISKGGVDGPRGWTRLVDNLLRSIDAELDQTDVQLHLTQLKEKFGGMRFYYQLSNSASPDLCVAVDKLVNDACAASTKLCVVCGDAASMKNFSGYISPFCDKHTAADCRCDDE